MFKLRQLRCSFCGKREAEVEKMVAGPRVYICDACVAAASRLMEGGTHDGGQTHVCRPTVWQRLSTRVRQLLGGGGARRVSTPGVSV